MSPPSRSTLLSVSLTSRKLSTFAGSKPRWFVSKTWACQVVFGISLPISSAAFCPGPSGRLGFPTVGWVWHLTRSPLCVLPSGVRLVDSDPFRHVCQLYADNLVILAESHSHFQHALDVVHAWGLRWRVSFGIGPKSVMVFGPLRGRPGCSVHLGDVSPTSVPQYRYLGVPLSRVDLVIASSTKLAPGVVAKVCLSLSLSPDLSSLLASFPSSFGLEFVGDQHFSNSTSCPVVRAVIFLGGRVLLLSQLSTANLASAMHSSLPRTCILFVWSLGCHGQLFLSPCVFRFCSTVQGTWSH